MKTREAIDLMVCVDCALFIANGETEGADPSWNADTIEQMWPDHHLVNGDADLDNAFSRSPCDACGTRLDGTRIHCVAIA